MKNTRVIAFTLVMILALTNTQDISLSLQNRNIVDKEIRCILQRNSCDVIGKQIKALLPEALHNGCARCSPQQALNAKKLMSFMKQNYPNEWRMILQMYLKPKLAV
ncbi:PREDICTED: ejaculatory bulb-specific protein 3 [Ceratosolen solmsi marchali]|uniref:Ejaculatory bulb-specific protein 3 n=1 Tax=Ceratosolen solmsi marchali TaxID=326594 RepID=A0AAJ6YDS1_9HYME|nr:PREDICTED: ejaculatory bulb-specific protein 3 [Ceratosolen solmsi marchali]